MGECYCRICDTYKNTVCEKCGSTNNSGLYFCGDCGAKMMCPSCKCASFDTCAPYNPAAKQ